MRITTKYPGASAQTIENSVTQIIEQSMTGLDNFLYMKSESSSSGNVTITLTFEAGTDPRYRPGAGPEQAAAGHRPAARRRCSRKAMQVNKSNSTFLMIVGLISTDGSLENFDLGDYMVSTLRDPLSRTPGVGSIQIFGSSYAMRIWLDPNKLNSFQLTPSDVAAAIKAQNHQVAVGNLGGTPSVAGQQVSATMMARTMMSSPEEFAEILLEGEADGAADPPEGCRPGRDRRRELLFARHLQQPAGRRHGHHAGHRGQRPGHRRGRQGQDRRA